MIVLDASVACKLMMLEAGSEAAKELLESTSSIIAPSIIRQEVTGAILRRFRMNVWSEPDTKETCDRWEGLLQERFTRLIPIDTIHSEAVEVSYKLRHPLIDCFYVAAAQKFKAELFTADRDLFDRAKTVYNHVTLFRTAS